MRDGDCEKIRAGIPVAARRVNVKNHKNRNRILTIPKGLWPPAQGCEARATLGHDAEMNSTATRLWQIPRRRPFNPKRIFHPIRFCVASKTPATHPEIQSCDDAPPARRCIASLVPDWIGSRKNPRSHPAIRSRRHRGRGPPAPRSTHLTRPSPLPPA